MEQFPKHQFQEIRRNLKKSWKRRSKAFSSGSKIRPPKPSPAFQAFTSFLPSRPPTKNIQKQQKVPGHAMCLSGFTLDRWVTMAVFVPALVLTDALEMPRLSTAFSTKRISWALKCAVIGVVGRKKSKVNCWTWWSHSGQAKPSIILLLLYIYI